MFFAWFGLIPGTKPETFHYDKLSLVAELSPMFSRTIQWHQQDINYWSCFIKASADAERGTKLHLNGAGRLLGTSGFQANG
jgi:hypothetical protein